ncbi:MAG TPA: DUF4857 domain-containing protein [Spirochaetota bacterium]|jgi:hypothetical protein|nr:DUF4857 domain-containing protein [Spirochaetota bacterium]HOH36114.1 DUF4857 domain-containing protein [Spirochaetota bacterium]HPY01743.1 DUF4857 domain-containing protein [Spirochaetota bacterium]HQA52376.1 DUF4857 domain-containing protein [Spirochaetota bacterium]
MDIKGFSFKVVPGESNDNIQRLFNLKDYNGSPVIKYLLIPDTVEYKRIYITVKHINSGKNFIINASLYSLRQNHFIPVNLPEGEYEITFRSTNIVDVIVDFTAMVDYIK